MLARAQTRAAALHQWRGLLCSGCALRALQSHSSPCRWRMEDMSSCSESAYWQNSVSTPWSTCGAMSWVSASFSGARDCQSLVKRRKMIAMDIADADPSAQHRYRERFLQIEPRRAVAERGGTEMSLDVRGGRRAVRLSLTAVAGYVQASARHVGEGKKPDRA